MKSRITDIDFVHKRSPYASVTTYYRTSLYVCRIVHDTVCNCIDYRDALILDVDLVHFNYEQK